MLYKVRARFRENKTAEFFRKLTDGTIAAQKPDGAEIVASMKRAKITEPGWIEWFETCYCDSPLQHERETVYDQYLTDITAAEAERKAELGGESFWTFLRSRSD